jgi:nitroimidazol reductase NimA-like FMN-containing flavoprotein (pyridoxamine 5'-phosphate oxidase superfamily)
VSPNPRSKSTATKENALDSQEIDAFLAIKQDGRLGSNRGDGWWHVTPIWYLWEGGRFFHTLGAGRRHVANLREDSHATLCVDEDPRLTEGLEAGARSVVCFATAELSEDEGLIRDVTEKILVRYLGPEASAYVDPIMAEGRTIVTLTPSHWLTWDYNKD